MEIILLGVTLGSMLIALIMGTAAWRLAREERARATARVAALAAAANAPQASAAPAPLDDFGTESTTAVIHAAARAAARDIPEPPRIDPEPSPIAVESRPPRTSSRVATFTPTRSAAVTADQVPDLVLSPPSHDMPLRPAASAPIAASFLEVDERRPSEGRQRGLAIAAAVLFVGLASGAYWLISGNATTTPGATTASSTSTAPLELMSLRHERVGQRLSLSGLVRNPAAGVPVDGLTAVVFLFDAQGAFIASAQSGVDFKHLAAGDESPFVIAVDAPSNIARYRVSFRTDAGVVTHVDRRNEQPAATAIAGNKS
jgi:hypothetical protein